jgi:hypothetical protein
VAGCGFLATHVRRSVVCRDHAVTFWARQYQASPQQIKDWWPDVDDPGRMEVLRREQRYFAAKFRMWSNRAHLIYNAGLLCLLAALTLLAIPPESQEQSSVLRWLAVAVGAVAFIVSTIWNIGSFTGSKWIYRLQNPPST